MGDRCRCWCWSSLNALNHRLSMPWRGAPGAGDPRTALGWFGCSLLWLLRLLPHNSVWSCTLSGLVCHTGTASPLSSSPLEMESKTDPRRAAACRLVSQVI